MSCFYRMKGGETCGGETGSGRRCPAHVDVVCSLCDKPAWVDCPECGKPFCRRCVKGHVRAHNNELGQPKGADAPIQAEYAILCPACVKPDATRLVRTIKGEASKSLLQVYCSGCGSAGPTSPTVAIATTQWNRLPRGRPAIYEGIRTRALAIIETALTVYEQAVEGHTLTTADCEAVAKMLEAATMAVDTWEM